MNYNTLKNLLSLWSTRLIGWRLAFVSLAVVCLMAVAFSVAGPSDIGAFETGSIPGAWGMYLFLVATAVIFGVGFGVADVTTYRDLILTLPWSPIAIFTRRILTHLVRAITRWSASASVIALYVECQIAQSLDKQVVPLPLTHDSWPSGSPPLIVYDAS